jgi:hypothetical protein
MTRTRLTEPVASQLSPGRHFLQVEAQMEPPPELLMPLLPYQKEFLAWGVAQEQGPVRGGILADEMGELLDQLIATEWGEGPAPHTHLLSRLLL